MIEELIEYFKNTPKEQIKTDWEQTKHLDKKGITMQEFLNSINSASVERRAIGNHEAKEKFCENCKHVFVTCENEPCNSCFGFSNWKAK